MRVLADGRPFAAGRHTLAWDGADERGRRVSAGIYFMRITAGRDHDVRKVVRVN